MIRFFPPRWLDKDLIPVHLTRLIRTKNVKAPCPEAGVSPMQRLALGFPSEGTQHHTEVPEGEPPGDNRRGLRLPLLSVPRGWHVMEITAF